MLWPKFNINASMFFNKLIIAGEALLTMIDYGNIQYNGIFYT